LLVVEETEHLKIIKKGAGKPAPFLFIYIFLN